MTVTKAPKGDNYFNPYTKKWTTKDNHEGKPLERAFNQFILDPIFKIFSAMGEPRLPRPMKPMFMMLFLIWPEKRMYDKVNYKDFCVRQQMISSR